MFSNHIITHGKLNPSFLLGLHSFLIYSQVVGIMHKFQGYRFREYSIMLETTKN